MSDIQLSFIVIAGTVLAAGLIFLLVGNAKKRRLEKLGALAERRGWQFEPYQTRLSSGYTMQGARWKLEAVTRVHGVDVEPHLSNVYSETVFYGNPKNDYQEYVLIGPALQGVGLGTFGQALQRRVIEHYLGPQVPELKPVWASSSPFSKNFLALASDPSFGLQMVTPGLEAFMTRWEKHKPVVKVTPEGLDIRLSGVAISRPEDVEAMVEMGISLLENEG